MKTDIVTKLQLVIIAIALIAIAIPRRPMTASAQSPSQPNTGVAICAVPHHEGSEEWNSVYMINHGHFGIFVDVIHTDHGDKSRYIPVHTEGGY